MGGKSPEEIRGFVKKVKEKSRPGHHPFREQGEG
jgi:hypothetical protein